MLFEWNNSEQESGFNFTFISEQPGSRRQLFTLVYLQSSSTSLCSRPELMQDECLSTPMTENNVMNGITMDAGYVETVSSCSCYEGPSTVSWAVGLTLTTAICGS